MQPPASRSPFKKRWVLLLPALLVLAVVLWSYGLKPQEGNALSARQQGGGSGYLPAFNTYKGASGKTATLVLNNNLLNGCVGSTYCEPGATTITVLPTTIGQVGSGGQCGNNGNLNGNDCNECPPGTIANGNECQQGGVCVSGSYQGAIDCGNQQGCTSPDPTNYACSLKCGDVNYTSTYECHWVLIETRDANTTGLTAGNLTRGGDTGLTTLGGLTLTTSGSNVCPNGQPVINPAFGGSPPGCCPPGTPQAGRPKTSARDACGGTTTTGTTTTGLTCPNGQPQPPLTPPCCPNGAPNRGFGCCPNTPPGNGRPRVSAGDTCSLPLTGLIPASIIPNLPSSTQLVVYPRLDIDPSLIPPGASADLELVVERGICDYLGNCTREPIRISFTVGRPPLGGGGGSTSTTSTTTTGGGSTTRLTTTTAGSTTFLGPPVDVTGGSSTSGRLR